MAQFIKYGSDITVSESTGGITIPAGTYLITASVYIQTNSIDSSNTNKKAHRGVYIIDETGTELCGAMDGMADPNTCTVSSGIGLAPKIMSFSTSKTLYLYARCLGWNATVYNDSKSTYLTILRIK